MTVETDQDKVVLPGNGVATVFSFDPIVIFATTEVEVTLTDANGVDTLLVEGAGESNYTVTAAAGSFPSATGETGSVTYPSTGSTRLQTGETITIRRVLPLLQLTDLENQGGYFADVQETALDKIVMQNIQQQEELNRAIKLSVSETTTPTFPPVAQRANKFAAFDGNGDIIASTGGPDTVVPVSPFMETVLDDLDAPAVLTTLGFSTFVQGLRADADAATFRSSINAVGSDGDVTIDGSGTLDFRVLGDINTGNPVEIYLGGHNSVNDNYDYVQISATIVDNTDGSEDGQFDFQTSIAGTMTSSMKVGAGVQVGAPTGGDQGVGTLNSANGVFTNGDELSKKWTYTSEVNINSGTSVSLATGLPSDIDTIEILFDSVSQNSANTSLLLQIGDSGGFENTGYQSIASIIAGSGANTTTATNGFVITQSSNFDAADVYSGVVRLTRWGTTNKWLITGSGFEDSASRHTADGRKTLSAELDRLQITTDAGTATFDGSGTGIVRYR